MRLRVHFGILLGLAAVAVAGPPSWLPWGSWVRALLPAWWCLPVIASGLLLAAAACLPGGKPGTDDRALLWPTQHRPEAVACGLGLLLLAEPLLHLAVLGYLTRAHAPGAEDILLPGPSGRGLGELGLRISVLCLLAPMCEELFFRGRLLPLLAGRLGPWAALSFTSLAFAVAHGSPISCLIAAPVGVLLGWLRLKHRDLGACVLVHQAHNGLFLLAGPALVTAPLSAAVLAVGGALMLTLAALHGSGRARAVPAGLTLAAALALALPPLLTLKDAWWAEATARLAGRMRSGPAVMVARLDAQRRRGRLTAERAAALRTHLDVLASPAARAARLWVDGPATQAADADEAAEDLRAAAQVDEPPPSLTDAVVALGLRWPEALAAVTGEEPAAVARLLGADGAARAIAASTGASRKQLLAALELAWPGRLASVLLALPADEVTALERRHLRLHYPDAARLIASLDTERQAAWMPVR
jgi:membrane protease YdiL (CAAX protease family)